MLKPDRVSLRHMLEELGPGDLLQLQHQSRELFSRAVASLKTAQGEADVHALDVSLEVLHGEPGLQRG